MTGTPGPQTIESIVAFWICIPLGVIFGLITLATLINLMRDNFDEFVLFGAFASALATVGFFGGYIWGMYPDDFAHHHYTRYTGTVAETNSRLIASGTDGGGTDQKFVVSFKEAPNEQYGVIDTRAALVKPGQTLTIDCVKIWQQAGTEGQDCQFVSVR